MILRAKYLTYGLDENTNHGNSYGMTWVMFGFIPSFCGTCFKFQSLELGLLSYEALPNVLQLCPTVSFSCKAALTSSHSVLSCFCSVAVLAQKLHLTCPTSIYRKCSKCHKHFKVSKTSDSKNLTMSSWVTM